MRLRKTTIPIAVLFVVASMSSFTGCRSRAFYYQQADRDAHFLVRQKSDCTPWAVPQDFSLSPPAHSRLATNDCSVCPQLPSPTTSLYSYNLPYPRSSENATEPETQQEDTNPLASPIPPDAWAAIPAECLGRMLDFESIRSEARATRKNFQNANIEERSNDAQKLTLRDVIDLALLNSREYQTQKEALYLVSLQLAQERFDYQTRFGAGGNGSALDYAHNRSGSTVNRLSIPTGVRVEKMLVTGGDLLASFANNVLLTFNGPSGFSADVSSDILIQIAQPLLQKDVRFESLTRAERALVYAVRDFARFRKQFFVDFSGQYYALIRTFRQIEIDSQNYFSLVRAFKQAEAEYQAGLVPRFQVDQVEQSLLSGRGGLIATCNGVEQALDRLKISLGIPTETPINVNLKELNELTRSDQVSVSADSTSRVLKRLTTALEKPDRSELVSTAAVLLDRVIESANLIQGESQEQLVNFKIARERFLVDYERLNSQQILADLRREIESDSPSTPVIFQRSLAHSAALLNLITRQLELARLSSTDTKEVEEGIEKFEALRNELAESVAGLRDELQTLINEERLAELPALVDSSNVIRGQLESLVADIDQMNQVETEVDPQKDLDRIVAAVNDLIQLVSQTLEATTIGLTTVEIDQDDAMITALVMRFELMNQRGILADDWRQVKLAADELRSVINLTASQRISTLAGSNQPFNFSFDDSSTSLGLSVDSPLNRFAQRNSFRGALIGYQRALRNLAQLEDNIKLSIRNDLRSLALDREQYLIAVASAALAYERVVSTSLEFRLGTGGVSARDFLEAQTAYTDALSNVASRHIDYIIDRTQLFFDLELLEVDEEGFWNELNEESFQPQPWFDIPEWGQPVYGELPAVRYSEEIRQMLGPTVQPEYQNIGGNGNRAGQLFGREYRPDLTENSATPFYLEEPAQAARR